MKTFTIASTFIFLAFNQSPAFGQSTGENSSPVVENWDISSVSVELQTPERSVKRPSIKRVETGAPFLPINPSCSLEDLEKNISLNTEKKSLHIYLNSFFKRCEKYLSSNRPKGAAALLDFYLIQYQPLQNKNVFYQKIENFDGTSTRALFLLKDNKPRPFVILQCGLFCNGGPSASVNNMLMSLYDQSPFHVVVLASNSAPSEIFRNKTLEFGGYREAQRVYEFAKWLRSSDYSNLISSLHLVGLSLGGHSALYGALYNSIDVERTGIGRTLQSVTAVCPVVELDKSMKHLFGNSIVGKFASKMTWNNLVNVHSSLEYADEFYSPSRRPANSELSKIVSGLSTKYIQESQKHYGPFMGMNSLESVEDFWSENKFIKSASLINTPLLVIASKDDLIVKNSDNTGLLLKDSAASKNPQISILNLNYGNHCAVSSSYGLGTMSALLEGHILANSKEFKSEYLQSTVDLGLRQVAQGSQFSNFEWIVQRDSTDLILNMDLFNPYGDGYNCTNQGPFTLKSECLHRVQIIVSPQQLPFELPKVKNATQAQVLTRWMNKNISLQSKDGKNILGTNKEPQIIRWLNDIPI